MQRRGRGRHQDRRLGVAAGLFWIAILGGGAVATALAIGDVSIIGVLTLVGILVVIYLLITGIDAFQQSQRGFTPTVAHLRPVRSVEPTHGEESLDEPHELLIRVLGEAIRRERDRRGISLGQLADLLEVSPPLLSQIERGMRAPRTADVAADPELARGRRSTTGRCWNSHPVATSEEPARARPDGQQAEAAALWPAGARPAPTDPSLLYG